MSNDTFLLFLHGIGEGDKENKWKAVLSEALAVLGYPELDDDRIIAPKYAHALRGWDEKEALPGLTIKQLAGDAAKRNRRDFERRTGAIEFRLGRSNRGEGYVGGDALVSSAVFGGAIGVPRVTQAHNYLNDPQVRAQVLNRILSQLPESGRLVIIGYSLGSVIAADLIRRLPLGLDVAALVTIGSPLSHGGFDVDKLRDTLKDPPANLSWWVNFWNTTDPIAAHRGVSSVFPWMVDFRIDTKKILIGAHEAEEYLADESVASAIGFALFGSSSKEVAEVERGVAIPLDTAEFIAVLALRYAHILKSSLDGELQDRFAGALRHVQAIVVSDIRERNASENRALPSDVARLAFDLSDSTTAAPEPLPMRYMDPEEAVAILTVLAAENVIRPFEISVPKAKWHSAMKELSAELGLRSQFGADVFESAKLAQETLSGGPQVNWFKWGALGVGAVALVVATGGIAALVAAPGLAGAAAITSALAAFGPGGMIGGLLTAGTLVTAGGGGIAYGLASAGTSAEVLEAFVVRRLSATILRQRQNLEPDPLIWKLLVATEIELRREHERLDEFSDDSAPTVKELKRKIVTVERALKYLRDNGFEPGVPSKR